MLAWAVEAAGRTAEATGAASMAMFVDRARVVLGWKGPTLRCQSALPRLMFQVRWSAKSGLICTSAAGPASWDSSQGLTSGPLYQGTPCLSSSRLLFCFRLARRINSSALPVLAPPVRRQAACRQVGLAVLSSTGGDGRPGFCCLAAPKYTLVSRNKGLRVPTPLPCLGAAPLPSH